MNDLLSSVGTTDKLVPSSSRKTALIGFFSPALWVLCYFVLRRLDDTTELWPSHDTALEACFWLAGVGAALGCGIVFRVTKQYSVVRRIWTAFCIGLVGFLVILLPAMPIVDIVNGRLDFPPRTTRTFTALVKISRAYRTHGKGASWDIQTMPLWSNMNISESDYQFMLTHRRPGDPGLNADEISSKGYFCAKVTMQQSGDALRVLHAGGRTLLPGTVIFCP